MSIAIAVLVALAVWAIGFVVGYIIRDPDKVNEIEARGRCANCGAEMHQYLRRLTKEEGAQYRKRLGIEE